nr:hypothetical protein [Tanacetum cinerariifolium]
MSSKDSEEEKTKSDSDDDSINLTGSMVESSKKKKLKKFNFVTEQGDHDPLDKLIDLERKKMKHDDDINDLFRQDFVTIEDFKDFQNEMLYTVQEIFFRLHQSPGLDNHARTLSSFFRKARTSVPYYLLKLIKGT